MDRRSFLGRLVMGAAAVLGCGMVSPKAEAAEIDPIMAKIDDALANPDKHLELWARVQELTGESGYLRTLEAQAEAADSAPIFGPDMAVTGYVIRTRADFESGLGTWSDVAPVTSYSAAPGLYTRYSYPIITDHDLAQAKADAYNRGRSIDSARIESRLAEGLPIKRGES